MKALGPKHLGATQKRVTNSDLKESVEAHEGSLHPYFLISPSCLNKIHTCIFDFQGLNNPKRCLTPYERLLRSCEKKQQPSCLNTRVFKNYTTNEVCVHHYQGKFWVKKVEKKKKTRDHINTQWFFEKLYFFFLPSSMCVLLQIPRWQTSLTLPLTAR